MILFYHSPTMFRIYRKEFTDSMEIPRDTVLKAYKEQQLKEMKHQQSHSRRNSMEISYR